MPPPHSLWSTLMWCGCFLSSASLVHRRCKWQDHTVHSFQVPDDEGEAAFRQRFVYFFILLKNIFINVTHTDPWISRLTMGTGMLVFVTLFFLTSPEKCILEHLRFYRPLRWHFQWTLESFWQRSRKKVIYGGSRYTFDECHSTGMMYSWQCHLTRSFHVKHQENCVILRTPSCFVNVIVQQEMVDFDPLRPAFNVSVSSSSWGAERTMAGRSSPG